jgi:hypothetical protein
MPGSHHGHPFSGADAQPHVALIERIVEQEKPAYVSYDLEFRPATNGETES